MKRSELFFSFSVLVIDAVMIFLAAVFAWLIRFHTDLLGPPIVVDISLEQIVVTALVATPIFLLIFALTGLYNARTTRMASSELYKVFLAMSTGILVIIILIFLQRELFSSRFIVLAAWIFGVVLVTAGRWVVRSLQRGLLKKGVGVHRVLLIGESKAAKYILKVFKNNPKSGYQVIDNPIANGSEQLQEMIKQLSQDNAIDEIILADPMAHDEAEKLVDLAHELRLDFKFAPDLFETRATNIDVRAIAGIPIIELKRTPLDGWGRIAKRVLDIAGSLLLIIVTSPILIVTSIAVKLGSKGPIIFKNERVSREGKFNVYKFRSMFSHLSVGPQFEESKEKALEVEKELIEKKSIKEGPVYKIEDDPRVTSVGKFIRKTSIDELPQFFNVLMGNMSLVGPRPHQPREVAKYKKHHRKVLAIKPGITGMAQISGRSDLDFEDEVRLDTFYIENWSFWRDIQILLRTPFVLLRRRRAL